MMAMAGLAKLAEELGELVQVVGKKIAYFDTDIHPDGKKPLRKRLEEEMGDVLAAIDFVVAKWDLDKKSIEARRQKKIARFYKWDRAA